jgi:hypothetical protein
MPRVAGYGKPTVEATQSIDVGRWHRLGYLNDSVSLTWSWRSNSETVASIGVIADRNVATLRYRVRSGDGKWKDLEQSIPICWSPCRFGGERPWFRCNCGRRVMRLYGAGCLFACRHCYGLVYASQQAVPRDRNIAQARKIRERLGGDANVLNLLPLKPSGMHWRTYYRFRRQHDRACAASLAGLAARLERITGPGGRPRSKVSRPRLVCPTTR